jgi:DNA-binding MarR family transcriptional regulator
VTDDTPWLSNAELATWAQLAGVIMTLPPAVDAQLKRDSCVNFFEYSILVGLAREPGRSLKLSSLALYAYGSQSRLSHAISRLERQGWVVRRAACDVRAIEAVLTDEGYAKLVEAAPGHVREVRRLVIDALSPEQLDQLGGICRALLTVTFPETRTRLDDALCEDVTREQARAEVPEPG